MPATPCSPIGTLSGPKEGRFSRSIAGADIGLFEGLDEGNKGKSNVIVAVDDGGIDIKHPDLRTTSMSIGRS